MPRACIKQHLPGRSMLQAPPQLAACATVAASVACVLLGCFVHQRAPGRAAWRRPPTWSCWGWSWKKASAALSSCGARTHRSVPRQRICKVNHRETQPSTHVTRGPVGSEGRSGMYTWHYPACFRTRARGVGPMPACLKARCPPRCRPS